MKKEKYLYYIVNDGSHLVLCSTMQASDKVAIHWAQIELEKRKGDYPDMYHATLWRCEELYGITKIQGFYKKQEL